MKSKDVKWFLLLVMISVAFEVSAQNPTNNKNIIATIYDAIEKNDMASIVAYWQPEVEWYKSSTNSDKNETTASEDVVPNDIFKLMSNMYTHPIFFKMQIDELEVNLVLVTGMITSLNSETSKRESSEFKHIWWLKDGKVKKYLQ